jgi:hypothetical protein
VQALAAVQPGSQQLWQLEMLSLARQGDAAAVVQQVLQAAEEVSPSVRQELLAQLAETAAEQQAPLDSAAAKELIAACAASGSEAASAPLLALYWGMLAAGQRPSAAAHRSALAALLRQLDSQQEEEELDLSMLVQMLGQEAELAPALTDADWDAVLAAALRAADVALLWDADGAWGPAGSRHAAAAMGRLAAALCCGLQHPRSAANC